MKAFTFLARRFVAGETALEAVAAGRALHAKGIKATFDLLGEDVLDRDAAKRCAELNRELLRVIPDGRLRKLRQLAVGWPDLLEVLRSRRKWIVPFSLLLWLAHLFL